MSIVSDSSALINLARIGRLDLLQQLYREVTIPEAVWHEVVVEGAGQVGADIVKDATWIKTRAVTNKDLVRALRQELDAGGSRSHCAISGDRSRVTINGRPSGKANRPPFRFALYRVDWCAHRGQEERAH